MTDVVFVLGKGSFWQDNEIRYSIRSIVKYLKNYRDIYVIGRLPDFLNRLAIHVPVDDKIDFPACNINHKVMIATMLDTISDDFLFFNDDFFLLDEFDAGDFPYYLKGDLSSLLANPTNYAITVQNTINLLKDRNLPTVDFDHHSPIIFNKKKYQELMNTIDWSVAHGYCIQSLYCNTYGVKGEFQMDGKIHRQKSAEQLRYWFSSYKVFSVDDMALDRNLKRAIESLYPVKSKYEI